MASKGRHKAEDLECNESAWNLDTIPPELFFHICSFLNAKFVVKVLSQVCLRFNELIEDNATWRSRIFAKWPNKYPLIKESDDFDWKEACIQREQCYNQWHDSAKNMKRYDLERAHGGAVDVIRFIQDGLFCASGSRDRSIKLWNVYGLDLLPPGTYDEKVYSRCLFASNDAAHDGWIWSMAYDNRKKTLYTGSFDETIKAWDISYIGLSTTTYRFSTPILCLDFNGNTLVCGCFNNAVVLVDSRMKLPAFRHLHHKKSVLCLISDEKFIISGSEDQTIVVYDKVAGKVRKHIKLTGFPLSMSYGYNQILAGDINGAFHVIDTADQKFDLVNSFPSGHISKITGIQHSLGSVITCSTDKTIRVLEPNVNPNPIAVLNCKSEIAKVATHKSVLASANSDDSISVWLPSEKEVFKRQYFLRSFTKMGKIWNKLEILRDVTG